MDKIPKLDPTAHRELYLECLGQLIGLEFEPRSGLRGSVTKVDKGDRKDLHTIPEISLEKANTWRPGAISSCLKKLGYNPNGKKGVYTNPQQPQPVEILKSLIFQQREPEIEGLNGIIKEPLSLYKRPKTREEVKLDELIKPWQDPTKRSNSSRVLFSSEPTVSSIPHTNIPDEDEEMEQDENDVKPAFQSAYDLLRIKDKAKGIKRDLGGNNAKSGPPGGFSGLTKSNYNKRKNLIDSLNSNEATKKPSATSEPPSDLKTPDTENPELTELMAHPQMKCFETKIVESILSEVMEPPQLTGWDDIAGLKGPKAIIKEVIIWPMLRPDIFTGLRASPKGILLFGPPGTGKTMIGRLIATQSSSSFFNISASSLTSKWIGDGEKLVRCLFQVARIKQPSVIFIDEIDSILTQRSDSEHEASRRMKTEFLIQFDGCGTNSNDRVLVIGVTNRPQELDEAARRRLVKRIYIPLPDIEGRKQIVQNLMKDQKASLSDEDYNKIAELTIGFSGADMKSLSQDASYGPIRDIVNILDSISPDKVRPIEVQDFMRSVKNVKSSVADKDLTVYDEWDDRFGCHVGD